MLLILFEEVGVIGSLVAGGEVVGQTGGAKVTQRRYLTGSEARDSLLVVIWKELLCWVLKIVLLDERCCFCLGLYRFIESNIRGGVSQAI